jgi:hypothetical protein
MRTLLDLERADEVPSHVGRQLVDLVPEFLCPVLTKVAMSLVVQRADRLDRPAFGHGNERHLRPLPPACGAGCGHTFLDVGETHGTQPTAASRSLVPSRGGSTCRSRNGCTVRRPRVGPGVGRRRLRRDRPTSSPRVRPTCPTNLSATSGPTSKQHERMCGPMWAERTSPTRSTALATTPESTPRQPAWTTATRPGPCITTPRQSAVKTARGKPTSVVNSPSASPWSPLATRRRRWIRAPAGPWPTRPTRGAHEPGGRAACPRRRPS